MDDRRQVVSGPATEVDGPRTKPRRARLPWLEEALGTVAEFHEASLGLVAWELGLRAEEVAPAWHHARSRGLITPTRLDEESGEQMYSLTDLGRTRSGPG